MCVILHVPMRLFNILCIMYRMYSVRYIILVCITVVHCIFIVYPLLDDVRINYNRHIIYTYTDFIAVHCHVLFIGWKTRGQTLTTNLTNLPILRGLMFFVCTTCSQKLGFA